MKDKAVKKEKDNSRDIFGEFIKSYESFVNAQNSAAGIHSQDISERQSARSYAIRHASHNIPGLENIANDPIALAEALKSDASIDQILNHAILYSAALSEEIFDKKYKEIIEKAPEKGLAAIVLDAIPAVKLNEKEEYDDAIRAHAGYRDLFSVLQSDEEGKINHEKIYAALLPRIKERVKRKFANDEYLKDNKNLVDETTNVAAFVLANSPRICVDAVHKFIENYKREFNDALKTDEDKAKYAREVLGSLAENDKTRKSAMQGIYLAAKQKKAA